MESNERRQQPRSGLLRRVTIAEWTLAAAAAAVVAALVILEPGILEAPTQNLRTAVFTFGGTALALATLLVMLRFGIPPLARILVLGVPFVAVSWWLLSPYFVDDVVDDRFETSIEAAGTPPAPPADTVAPPTTPPAPGATASPAPTSTTAAPATAPPPAGPVLIGVGEFVGLAGHDGTGDAGFFRLDDGSHVLRFENFDIENGPELHVYVNAGADQYSPGDDSIYLGRLRGNVGDQTYELPPEFSAAPGDWTVLVWCRPFSVEFVGATVTITG